MSPANRSAIATVTGNFRLTAPDADNDVRHVILDFGDTAFPILEGQSIGIVPPGSDASGRPHRIRLYSAASPRDGEKPRALAHDVGFAPAQERRCQCNLRKAVERKALHRGESVDERRPAVGIDEMIAAVHGRRDGLRPPRHRTPKAMVSMMALRLGTTVRRIVSSA